MIWGRLAGWSLLFFTMSALALAAWEVAFDRRPRWLKSLVTGALGLLWGVTTVVLVVRFIKGLGPTTAMTDRFPWGVWIGFIQSGVALSAGGFVTAATVHVFHIRRFESILRPAVLTAFLGYLFVSISLLIEIGRPYRLWHPLAMWQHHSIMFEVAWCVTLYMTVLALEFSPVVLEYFGWQKALNMLRLVTIPLVISGVLLSTLHQSSLGSMFLLMPEKVYPLWFTPLLPVFFLISSVVAGMCVLIVEAFYSSKLFGQSLEMPLLNDLGRAAALLLGLYLVVKGVDLTARGVWPAVWHRPVQGILFILELGVGGLLPALLLAQERIREKPIPLIVSALLAVGGVILNRLNTSWIGLLAYSGPVYVPSWMEFAVSFSLATGFIVLFAVAVRYLPVFPKDKTV